MSILGRAALLALIASMAACDQADSEPSLDAGSDAALDWIHGGEDIPEYSLGRLLISHPESPELTLFDLDTSRNVGSIPFAAGADVEAGGSGRYGYAFDPARGALHVLDPGQWLLSHIDHFHVMRGDYRLLPEQVSVPMLSSLLAHDGWITAYAASGTAAFFQERSITAGSFAPAHVSLGPAARGGVALVSRAQLVASDGVELSQRSVFDPSTVVARSTGCSEPRGVAAHGERLFVGCAEGLLQLTWDAPQELFVPELVPVGEPRVNAVHTTDRFEGALLQLGTRTLALLGSTLRRLELTEDIVALALRRQGTSALVLTRDGVAHELDLASAAITRSTPVLRTGADGARIALSHAYAYLTDPRAPRVLVLRLRTMQLESELPLSAAAFDLALVGVPSDYTDDRE